MGAITATAISHVVIETADVARARRFYAEILGAPANFGAFPDLGPNGAACRLPSGQYLALAQAAAPRTFADTAVHVAYRAAPEAVAAIVGRAGAAGISVHRYVEDRPQEVKDNIYFADPDGNRIQLVAAHGPATGIDGIDHCAALISDIEWEDDYWVETIGLRAAHRVGWATQDFVRARAWGEGKEDMAPGTRRWDQRYRDIPGARPGQERKVARPNPQLFLEFAGAGQGPVVGLFLAQSHLQEPPPEQTRGSPRIGLTVADTALDDLPRALAGAGTRVEGPVRHAGGGPLLRSVYLRDRCGVFFEFCSRA
ncbi:MAG: Glyoxalase/Bleomycin resistance protein/Dioxygenase superfamily [Pseudomonadota bacterium]|jgi:catechol 2,3-dioxygenase-like lactoylglutathione lyase family enzyme